MEWMYLRLSIQRSILSFSLSSSSSFFTKERLEYARKSQKGAHCDDDRLSFFSLYKAFFVLSSATQLRSFLDSLNLEKRQKSKLQMSWRVLHIFFFHSFFHEIFILSLRCFGSLASFLPADHYPRLSLLDLFMVGFPLTSTPSTLFSLFPY